MKIKFEQKVVTNDSTEIRTCCRVMEYLPPAGTEISGLWEDAVFGRVVAYSYDAKQDQFIVYLSMAPSK